MPRRALQLYLVVSALWILVYPWTSGLAESIAFLLAALGAVVAVAVGLPRVQPGRRAPWWLLLSALIVLSLGLSLRITDGENEAGVLLNAVGNLLILAAAIALIHRCGRNDAGGVIDAGIIGLALGGVLCVAVVLPADVRGEAARVNLFVVMFALSGVLGALVRVAIILTQPVAALWWLMLALVLALIANVVQATTAEPRAVIVANTLFMAAYLSVGAFGLHPTAPRLLRPGFVNRDDRLTGGRLVFLTASVAAVPAVVGFSLLRQADNRLNGAVLLASGLTVAILVMVRIGRLYADRSRIERLLREQAAADPLTGLPNRRTFLERLTAALSQKRRCVVLFCDLDDFKAVNDRWGHAVGDEVLTQVGRRLASAVRSEDIVSRMGGDEFLVLLDGPTQDHVDSIVARIRSSLDRPFELSTGTVAIGLSIGLAAGTGTTAEQLIRDADGRMYEAKRVAIGPRPSTRVVA